jgi:hypothetical protein
MQPNNPLLPYSSLLSSPSKTISPRKNLKNPENALLKHLVTHYNPTKELNMLYDAPDENEAVEIFSDGDLEEYWENIKRTSITEVNIQVQKEFSLKADKKPDQGDLVKSYLVDKTKPDSITRKDSTKHLSLLSQPKNEMEALLHRKFSELNDLRMQYNQLEIKFQKE